MHANRWNAKMAVAVLAVAVALAAVPAWAQPPAGAPNGQPGMGMGQHMGQHQGQGMPRGPRAGMAPMPEGAPPEGMGPEGGPLGPPDEGGLGGRDVRELVEMAKIMRMARDLELNDEQTVVLMRRYDEVRANLEALGKQRNEAMRVLRGAVDGDSDEAAVAAALEEVRKADEQLARARLDAIEVVGEGYTTTQKAKVYLAMQDFRRDMERMVQRAREFRRSGQPGMRPGAGGPGRNSEMAPPGGDDPLPPPPLPDEDLMP